MKKIMKITAIGLFACFGAWFLIQNWHANFLNFESEEDESQLQYTIAGRFEQEFMMTRDPATNTIPRERLLVAKRIADEKRAQMAEKESAIPIYWNERGPNNVGGRTRGLIFDANDPTWKTVWAGGVSGGLWHTTNIDAGTPSWTKSNDFFDNLNITSIAQRPLDPDIMYFGTGEQGFAFGIENGLGIWRSSDGGDNWTVLPFTIPSNPNDDFANINDIVVDNAGQIYAGTNKGVWRSIDQGASFQQVRTAGTNNAQDLEIDANGDIYATFNSNGIHVFRSGSWSKLSSMNFPVSFNRVELACMPGNANVVYAAFEATDGTCGTVVRSDDGGSTWPTVATSPDLGTICWYAFIMAVDPNDADRIWLGSRDMAYSDDAGATWNEDGTIHADNHAISYRPGNSNEMIFGCDGGVYRCTNASAGTPTLAAKNKTYNVTQFYANALHPDAGSNYMLGGTQDNGTRRFNNAGLNDTDRPTGNDGAYCFIDQDNPDIQITGSQNRQFFLSTDGGGSFSTFLNSKKGTLFATPADYDNANDIFYFSDNSDTLGRMSSVGSSNTITFDRITEFNGGKLSALTVAPVTANRLYVGTTGGRIIRIDDADQAGATTRTVLPRDPSMPFTGVACIEVEPGNENHLLVIFPNYGVNSIWESTDGGNNWVDLDNDLPDMPVRWAMFNPFNHDQVMLATELGIWSADDLDGVNTQWWPTNTFGLANVRVDMLEYRSSDHLVAAATHGRGMFTTDYFTMLNTCVANMFIGGGIPSGLYMAEDFISTDGTVNPGGKVIMQAGDYVDMTTGFWAKQGCDYWALIGKCNIPPAAKKADKWQFGNSLSESANRSKEAEINTEEMNLSCFPNPTTFRLYVNISLPKDGNYSLYVRSIQGRLVKSFASNDWHAAGDLNFEVDASGFEPGIYVLTLQTSDNTLSERFIVAR